MLTATLSHHFSAGHRIVGLVGPGAKCANVHGHTFGVEWTVRLPDLDAAAVEFANIKQLLRGWVDHYLDHGFIVDVDDPEMLDSLARLGSKLFTVVGRPTTEAIATLIAQHSQTLLSEVKLLEVRVSEGPHNAATWYADPPTCSDRPSPASFFDVHAAHMRGNAQFDQERC